LSLYEGSMPGVYVNGQTGDHTATPGLEAAERSELRKGQRWLQSEQRRSLRPGTAPQLAAAAAASLRVHDADAAGRPVTSEAALGSPTYPLPPHVMRVAAEGEEEEEEGAEAMPLQELAGGLEPLLVLRRNSA
jgi:hypothetical protein